jgi:hypothetical protein
MRRPALAREKAAHPSRTTARSDRWVLTGEPAAQGREDRIDTFDYLGECHLATPAGVVHVSVTGHDDGLRSAVAWLLPAGRRIGCLPWRPGRPEPEDEWLDRALAGPAVRREMVALLIGPFGRRADVAPEGERPSGTVSWSDP